MRTRNPAIQRTNTRTGFAVEIQKAKTQQRVFMAYIAKPEHKPVYQSE
ncbi:hypothetical protein [Mucilaginibacter jinjuensis]|uniref:Uncharacterized protein n=1 Tax=Mucilaginibacter jinjuensis TaxID=1176721 RepID=A0ABY7TC65_9SPHI|nr:hypothetical protein [Mucilaginibacter jinjuensis]WCT13298.1 hypothetical protein PQO05_05050 [Mucilaginibacter jinjuensis]